MTEPWDEAQRYLVERVYWAYAKYNEWPVYQWLEADLWERGFDALDIIGTFPISGGPWSRGRTYSDLNVLRRDLPRPDVRVGLSIGGLAKMNQHAQLVDVFIGALRLAAAKRGSAVFSPANVTTIRLESDDLLNWNRDPITAAYLMDVYEMLRNEPTEGFGAGGITQAMDEDDLVVKSTGWHYELESAVLRYRDVTIERYLAMVEAEFAEPPDQPAQRSFSNAPDLATAFTYLDTTWRLHDKGPLLQVLDLTGVTSLAFSAATADEYAARCSALADVIKSLQVPGTPGVSGHSVPRLAAYIKANLDDEGDYAGLDEIVATLDRVRNARDAKSHGAALPKGQMALSQLGVPGPPFDWTAAWETVRQAASVALMDLRDIIARLPAS